MLNLVSSDIIRESQAEYESDADLSKQKASQNTIIRSALNGGHSFTPIRNDFLQDPDIPYDVKGYIAEQLSRPPDWNVSCEGARSQNNVTGRDKMRRIQNDAKKHGYQGSIQTRAQDGRAAESITFISDDPEEVRKALYAVAAEIDSIIDSSKKKPRKKAGQPLTEKPLSVIEPFTGKPFTEKPESGAPFTGLPESGNPIPADPIPANPTQQKKDLNKKKIEQKKDEQACTRSVHATQEDNLPSILRGKPERPIDAANSFFEERLTASKSEERLTTVESSKNELPDLGSDVNSYNEHMDKRVQDAAFRYLVEQMNKHGLEAIAPKQLTPARRKPFRSRIRDAGGLQGWMAAVDRMMRSDFCLGKVDPPPGRSRFQLIFTKYILDPDFFLKVLEGNYDNRAVGQSGAGREVFMHEGKRILF